jgi:DNA-binding CsgD family transcriptional regulator
MCVSVQRLLHVKKPLVSEELRLTRASARSESVSRSGSDPTGAPPKRTLRYSSVSSVMSSNDPTPHGNRFVRPKTCSTEAEQDIEIILRALTQRQFECLTWVQFGKSSPDIGIILGVSGRTVDGHLLSVCRLLGVRTRLQAVLKAIDIGLLEPLYT